MSHVEHLLPANGTEFTFIVHAGQFQNLGPLLLSLGASLDLESPPPLPDDDESFGAGGTGVPHTLHNSVRGPV